MPLEHSASKESLERNMRTLHAEIGKSPHVQSRAQAIAIALETQRRARAYGGGIRGYDDGGAVQSVINALKQGTGSSGIAPGSNPALGPAPNADGVAPIGSNPATSANPVPPTTTLGFGGGNPVPPTTTLGYGGNNPVPPTTTLGLGAAPSQYTPAWGGMSTGVAPNGGMSSPAPVMMHDPGMGGGAPAPVQMSDPGTSGPMSVQMSDPGQGGVGSPAPVMMHDPGISQPGNFGMSVGMGRQLMHTGGGLHRAEGGFSMQKSPHLSGGWQERAENRNLMHGPILSAVPGRTDRHNGHVASGSYVIPADVVSGRGQGNTLAGMQNLSHLFKMGPYGTSPMGMRHGSGAPRPPKLGPMHAGGGKGGRGNIGVPTPVVLAGGEFTVPPEHLMDVVHPDLDTAHKIMDGWVLHERGKLRKTLAKLPGPAQD